MEFEHNIVPMSYMYKSVIILGFMILITAGIFDLVLAIIAEITTMQIFLAAYIILVVIGGIVYLKVRKAHVYTMQVTALNIEPDTNAVDPRVIVTFGNDKGSGTMELKPGIVDTGDALMLMTSMADENKIHRPMKPGEKVKVFKMDDGRMTLIDWVTLNQN